MGGSPTKKRKKHTPKKDKKPIFKSKTTKGIVAVAFILGLCLVFYNLLLHQPSTINAPKTSPYKAVIVDQLSISNPNQTFIETTTTMLTAAGFTVDYYKGENVTVNFYRNLGSHGYGLIVLRVHSLVGNITGHVILFTSEPYSDTAYVPEQLAHQVLPVRQFVGAPVYFGITSNFVRSKMEGTFENAIVIVMGCDGLKKDEMAEAFVEKGAKVYMSWNGPVIPDHTDKSTAHILLNLVAKNQTIANAVTETMKDVGPDPTYKSLLSFYPVEAGNYAIPKESYNSKS